jgi:hypothetical protein
MQLLADVKTAQAVCRVKALTRSRHRGQCWCQRGIEGQYHGRLVDVCVDVAGNSACRRGWSMCAFRTQLVNVRIDVVGQCAC